MDGAIKLWFQDVCEEQAFVEGRKVQKLTKNNFVDKEVCPYQWKKCKNISFNCTVWQRNR